MSSEQGSSLGRFVRRPSCSGQMPRESLASDGAKDLGKERPPTSPASLTTPTHRFAKWLKCHALMRTGNVS
jgi:hypothetical protein